MLPTTTHILSLPRMARRLGVSQRWLRGQADSERVPCHRAGHRYLFAPEAVERALASIAAREKGSGNE
jgi:hypothetical protein